MSDIEKPKISVTLSLSPSTYHFTNPVPPTLAFTLESHADKPLTIFTWSTPFNPKLGLVRSCFPIFDLTTETDVPQTVIQIQRAPFSRAKGSADEHLFLTLYPSTPVVVSTGFGRGGGAFPPDPKAVVERGWMRDKDGKELKIRRSKHGCGVDGLEGGHRYRVDVARGELMGIRWWWGTKEEIIVEPGGVDWNILPGEETPLDFGPIEGVEFDVEWSEESTDDLK